ncbi:EH domain-binding protein 1 isoform X4 [Hydra vulgaris]|uniref:EH domain-binding protein 1 isoform X4 n=1 Tax=Hydra vulgaris TaxID=6087 RepID=A0ABM4BF67_HYDVU
MGSVWKRIQRVGKKAAKFQFFVQLQSVTLECKKDNKWTPTKLLVLFQRGANRRKYSRPFNFQPGIAKPHRGVMVWVEPEELDIVCTLFKEDKQGSLFEPKEWTFIILDESSGRRKPLAQGSIDMAKFYSIEPSSKQMTIKMKSCSSKISQAQIDIGLSCIFLREGKATDEDMLSVASMMSLNEAENFNFDVDHHVPSLLNSSLRRSGKWSKRSSTKSNSRPGSLIGDSNSSVYLSCDSGCVSNVSNASSEVFFTPKKCPSSNSPSTKHSTPNQSPKETDKNKKNGPDSELLKWSQQVTANYKDVHVTDMTTSWQNGLAFCAILHHYHPELVDFSSLSPQNISYNNKLAFDGFEYLGIPKILDHNDMVRTNTPDKLTVMTYVHQIKEHFENKTKSSICSLVSQYKFITHDEDMFPTLSFNTRSTQKADQKKKKQSKKSKTDVSLRKAEIDSVTDEHEVNSIFEQLRLSESRMEVQKITKQMNEFQAPRPNLCKNISESIDEDEALNSVIGDNVKSEEMILESSANKCQTVVEAKNTDIVDSVPSEDQFSPISDNVFESKPKRKLSLTAELGQSPIYENRENFQSLLSSQDFSGDNISNLSDINSSELRNKSSTSDAENVSNENTRVKSSSDSSCSQKFSEPLFTPEKNKQEIIQERARQLIREARLKAKHQETVTSEKSETEEEVIARAKSFIEAQKRKEEILQQKLNTEEDRKSLLRSKATHLLEQAKLRGSLTNIDRSCSPSSVDAEDTKNIPVAASSQEGIQEVSQAGSQAADFKKNPFTLVKKRRVKSLQIKKVGKEVEESKEKRKLTTHKDAASYADSRKVQFDTFGENCRHKPKRDVAAEIAAELAKMKREEEQELNSVDLHQADPSGEDSDQAVTDEEVDVPVDDYFYELENFNLRSAGEYYNSELTELHKETKALDSVAQKLEHELRKAMSEGIKEEEEDLLQEWFNLVNKKNDIIRRQNEIALLAQGDDLESRCEVINRELRILSAMSECEKTEETHKREEALLTQLVVLVNQRNQLVQLEDSQLQQSAQDEEHVQTVLSQQTMFAQRDSAVGSMKEWVKGFKSKFW